MLHYLGDILDWWKSWDTKIGYQSIGKVYLPEKIWFVPGSVLYIPFFLQIVIILFPGSAAGPLTLTAAGFHTLQFILNIIFLVFIHLFNNDALLYFCWKRHFNFFLVDNLRYFILAIADRKSRDILIFTQGRIYNSSPS